MKILYFSWIKDKVGKSEEEFLLEDEVKTVKDLIIFLKSKNDMYKEAFEDISSIKVSINMEIANFEDIIANNDEIAFFPPMTGG